MPAKPASPTTQIKTLKPERLTTGAQTTTTGPARPEARQVVRAMLARRLRNRGETSR